MELPIKDGRRDASLRDLDKTISNILPLRPIHHGYSISCPLNPLPTPSCNKDKHLIGELDHSKKGLDVQLIVKLENIPSQKDEARKRRKKFEGY